MCDGVVVVVVVVVQVRSSHSKRSERDQQPAESEWWQHGLLHQWRAAYCSVHFHTSWVYFVFSHTIS